MRPISLHDPAVRELLAAAGLDPALAEPSAADPGMTMSVHLAMALGQRLGLDVAAQGALLHYLRRIDAIDQHLRALQSPQSQGARPRTVERPTPWHEPHG
jgi:hypothetical protein